MALYDRTVVYFDVIENRVLQILEHDGDAVNSTINQLINAVANSPSGKYALTGGDDQTARLWRLETGQQLRSIGSMKIRLISSRFHHKVAML